MKSFFFSFLLIIAVKLSLVPFSMTNLMRAALCALASPPALRTQSTAYNRIKHWHTYITTEATTNLLIRRNIPNTITCLFSIHTIGYICMIYCWKIKIQNYHNEKFARRIKDFFVIIRFRNHISIRRRRRRQKHW